MDSDTILVLRGCGIILAPIIIGSIWIAYLAIRKARREPWERYGSSSSDNDDEAAAAAMAAGMMAGAALSDTHHHHKPQ